MSTPDQPDTPPLTRRRLREIRNTGATPIITSAFEDEQQTVAAVPVVEEQVVEEAVAEEAVAEEAVVEEPVAEEPSLDEPAAEEADVDEPAEDSVADDSAREAPAEHSAAAVPAAPPLAPEAVDLGVAPLTRRQARQQERIRTASVPVITPDQLTPTPDAAPAPPPVISDVPSREAEEQRVERLIVDDAPTAGGATSAAAEEIVLTTGDVEMLPRDATADADADAPVVLVNPALGSGLLTGETPATLLPPSFDQLIARSASATGSIATPNALILSQTPAAAPLVAPVTATGEVLITGTFELPDGLGSVGHAPGSTDGKDLDVALIDGELPPASSPTPIAASAAISTVRTPGEEIIRPPVPEKGGRLMMGLVITAGVLALALVGVLVLIVTTGGLN